MQIKSTTPEAIKFFKNAQSTILNLYDRWQDEKEYEDINDYQKPLEPIAEKSGCKIIKMGKSPFSCIFSVGEREFKLIVKAKEYSYTRTK